MTRLQQNYQKVLEKIAQDAHQSQRNPDSIQLIAVSKTFPADDIRTLYQLGQRQFGENYIQEWLQKTETLSDLGDIVWHIIGDIQSNKTKPVAERAHWVHTISRLKIAERLSAQRPTYLPPLQVCIEVNIANEAAKHGICAEDVLPLAQEIIRLPNLCLRGLMCVAKADSTETELQQQFHTMKSLLTMLQNADIPVDTLSMGMSGDMDTAIACGATHIRVGSAIFGNRNYGENH